MISQSNFINSAAAPQTDLGLITNC